MKNIPVRQRDSHAFARFKARLKSRFGKLIIAGLILLIIGGILSTIAYEYRQPEYIQEQVITCSFNLEPKQVYNTSDIGFSYGYYTFIQIRSEASGIKWSLVSSGSYININDKSVHYTNIKVSGITDSNYFTSKLNDSNISVDPISNYYVSFRNTQNFSQTIHIRVTVDSLTMGEKYGYLNLVSVPIIILGLASIIVGLTKIGDMIIPDKR